MNRRVAPFSFAPARRRTTLRLASLCLVGSFCGAFAAQSAPPAEQPKPLTVEAIFAHGSLAGSPPGGLTWSPDGHHLTYLSEDQLMELDLSTGKSHVLVGKEKIATLTGAPTDEKDADHRNRYGMASYLWAPDSKHLLFDSNGRLWLHDLSNGTAVQVGFSGAGSGDDPKFSPDGKYLSFLREHALVVLPLRPSLPQEVTVAASNEDKTLLNGEVDWVYEEELDARSNYFWSPDSRNLVYLQTNESHVPQYPITDWIPSHATVDEQRYPQPGDPNPEVRVGVVGANGKKTTWIKLPIEAGQDYIPRFGWLDRKTVWVETLTRDHKHKNLYFADASKGQAKLVLAQSDDKFFDESYDLEIGDGQIVLSSWADGHTHIYLYSYNSADPLGDEAKLTRQLTKGEFEDGKVLAVDADRKLVFYSSHPGDPREQQLWQVSFDGVTKQLSQGAGFHMGNFSPNGSTYVDTYSMALMPPTVSVCQTGLACHEFWSAKDAGKALGAYRLRSPEPLEVKAQDGTTLYASLMLPEGATTAASVPLIVNPYGGPGVQSIVNRWGGDNLLFDELLAQHGFAVLHADNRGMGGRGRDFAQAAYHNFGPVQLQDQLTVVDAALARYPQLDPKRLGWWGWSWGGTFTLYALTHSDRFRAGVAVAPVTDWRNYDSIYTERYMSRPAEFPTGYHDFSVVNSADRLHGRLLLVHGTGDDNVHMENTIQFAQKLIEADLPYDLQLYPRKTHSIAGPDVRTHLFQRILAQFEQYLMPVATGSSLPATPAAAESR